MNISHIYKLFCNGIAVGIAQNTLSFSADLTRVTCDRVYFHGPHLVKMVFNKDYTNLDEQVRPLSISVPKEEFGVDVIENLWLTNKPSMYFGDGGSYVVAEYCEFFVCDRGTVTDTFNNHSVTTNIDEVCCPNCSRSVDVDEIPSGEYSTFVECKQCFKKFAIDANKVLQFTIRAIQENKK